MKYKRKIKRIVFKIIDHLFRVRVTWTGGEGRGEGRRGEKGRGEERGGEEK